MQVGLWLGAVGELLADAAAAPRPWLTPAEQARAAAIARDSRRDQFIAGRWALRRLLAATVGGEAADWQFDAAPDAPPALQSGPLPFTGRLALAHSRALVLCGWVPQGALGVDVEAGDRSLHDLEAWMRFALTPAERQACEAVPPARRRRALLMHWTAKEACGKASGRGLPFEALQRVEALPVADGQQGNAWVGSGEAAVITVHTPDGLPSLHWHAGAAQAAALAWSAWRVRESGAGLSG